MANIKEVDLWTSATNEWIRIHDIIQLVGANYGIIYAENSRETFRKQALHHFRTAALIEDNGTATNSPNYRYRLTIETLEMIRCIGDHKADTAISRFVTYHDKLGSLKMFALYPSLKDILDNGGTLFVDELNERLHPLLVILWRHSGIETDENAYREGCGWRIKAEESPVTVGREKEETETSVWGLIMCSNTK